MRETMWNLPRRIWPEEPASPACGSVAPGRPRAGGCDAEPPRFPGRSRAGRDHGYGIRCGDRKVPYRPRGDLLALQVTLAGLAFVAYTAPRLPGRSGSLLGRASVAVYRRWITRWTPPCPDTAESCSEHARRVFRDLPAHEALAAIRARSCSAHGGR